MPIATPVVVRAVRRGRRPALPSPTFSVSRHLGVVGDQDHSGAAAVQVLEELQNPLARSRVEAAGRLVGQQQPRPVRERPRHRDLLLLAAREPARPRARAVFQPDQRQQVASALAALVDVHSRERQGQRHVVLHGHGGDQVEGLEDRADALQPVVGDLTVGQFAERQPGAVDVA